MSQASKLSDAAISRQMRRRTGDPPGQRAPLGTKRWAISRSSLAPSSGSSTEGVRSA